MSPPTHRLTTVRSTSDHLQMLAERGAPNGAAVIARRQTEGRGRLGRRWETVDGASIYVSVLHRPERVDASLAGLTLDIGTALVTALAAHGLTTGLEWPNDLVVDGRKLGGILCELHTHQSKAFVVVGVGINGNVVADAFPQPLTDIATSLQILAGAPVDVAAITDDVVTAVRAACAAFERRGHADITAYVAHTVSIGCTVTPPDGRVGTVEAIAPDGALMVRFGDGAPEPIRAGVVDHR